MIPLSARHVCASVFSRISPPKNSAFDRLEPRRKPAQLERPQSHRNLIPKNLRQCPRCLSVGHAREACRQPIKCHACLTSGHIAASCNVSRLNSLLPDPSLKGKAVAKPHDAWFTVAPNAGPSKPPVFSSFGELMKARFPSWAEIETPPSICVPWTSSVPLQVGHPKKTAEPVYSPPCLHPV